MYSGLRPNSAQFTVASSSPPVVSIGTSCESTTQRAGAGAGSPVLQRGDFERALLLTGELPAVNSIAIKAPQTNVFQMRIQFMAEEGSFIKQGERIQVSTEDGSYVQRAS